MSLHRKPELRWKPMSAESAAGGCWASQGRMVASGTAASMSSTVETCCLPVRRAAPPCHAARMERPRSDAAAVQAIRPAPNAKMAGLSNEAATMASFSAASATRPVLGKRKYPMVNVPPSRSRDDETIHDKRCTIVPIATRDRHGVTRAGFICMPALDHAKRQSRLASLR